MLPHRRFWHQRWNCSSRVRGWCLVFSILFSPASSLVLEATTAFSSMRFIFGHEVLVMYMSVRHFKRLLKGWQFHTAADHKPFTFAIKPGSSKFSLLELRHLSHVAEYCTDMCQTSTMCQLMRYNMSPLPSPLLPGHLTSAHGYAVVMSATNVVFFSFLFLAARAIGKQYVKCTRYLGRLDSKNKDQFLVLSSHFCWTSSLISLIYSCYCSN